MLPIERIIKADAKELAIVIRRIEMLEAGELKTHSGRVDTSDETLASDKKELAERTSELLELKKMTFARHSC
jgi:hypothetical protein